MEIIQERQNIALFGADGQIGSAVFQSLQNLTSKVLHGGALVSLDWQADPTKWQQALSAVSGGDWTVVVANGLTDPSFSEEKLIQANVLFPQRVTEALARWNPRLLTIGTVFETFSAAAEKNPYFRSKRKLCTWVEAQARRPEGRGRFLHLRLHTVYGPDPRPHMFFGQIAASLRARQPFRMTLGKQLREYHHVDDIAASVVQVLRRSWEGMQVLELNSGQAIQLADLARALFEAFGKADLLQLGALPEPVAENRDRVFTRTSEEFLPSSREPIAGAIEAMRRALK
ncbi:MAG: NAD-dependent epimerase/dehydratase family protein [Bacteriovoracia bacterium]